MDIVFQLRGVDDLHVPGETDTESPGALQLAYRALIVPLAVLFFQAALGSGELFDKEVLGAKGELQAHLVAIPIIAHTEIINLPAVMLLLMGPVARQDVHPIDAGNLEYLVLFLSINLD